MKDKIQRYNHLVKESRDIINKAELEKRSMTAEEETRFDAIMGEVEQLNKQMDLEKKQLEAEKRTFNIDNAIENASSKKDVDVRSALNNFFRSSIIDGAFSKEERTALQMDSNVKGGYTLMPELMLNEVIEQVKDVLHVFNKARFFNLSGAQTLTAPELTSRPDDAEWTSELDAGTEDASTAFGKRVLQPNPLAKRLLVSRDLIAAGGFDIVGYITEQLAYKLQVPMENAFMTGSGAGQPLGIFTASAKGISTSRDISTNNTTTALTFDGLKNAKYALKAQYQMVAEWLFHRDALKMISKLKDNDGQYLWQPSNIIGQPDMLLGRPLNMSEFAPNTFTAGLYAGIIGDFSKYWVATMGGMEIQTLVELYAQSNAIGLHARMKADGAPILEEAFARVTLASS